MRKPSNPVRRSPFPTALSHVVNAQVVREERFCEIAQVETGDEVLPFRRFWALSRHSGYYRAQLSWGNRVATLSRGLPSEPNGASVSLNPDYRRVVESMLDECDAAIVGKPQLAEIFSPEWRSAHRAKLLGAASDLDVWYPSSYAKPHGDFNYPADWQNRLEEGAAVLLPKFDAAERNQFIARMRCEGGSCLSAEEELLLARGFANEFGGSAISFPQTVRGEDVPEFHVQIGETIVEVEAKGVMEEQAVRELNEYAIRSGQMSWVSTNPHIGDVGRLRAAIAKKLLSHTTGDIRVLALTQYTPWIDPFEAIPLIRTMATSPDTFNIPAEKHPLAITYVGRRWSIGIWLSNAVASRIGLDVTSRDRIRSALRGAFYPRSDGVFFDEATPESREGELIAKMTRRSYGG